MAMEVEILPNEEYEYFKTSNHAGSAIHVLLRIKGCFHTFQAFPRFLKTFLQFLC